MRKYIEKAKILNEILPYIRKFKDKIFVIKYGGSAMLDENLKDAVLQDIALLKLLNIHPVIVHGGGPEINKALKRVGKEPQFINGLRITDKETMTIVEEALSNLNKEIAQKITDIGINTQAISGQTGNTLQAQKKYIDGYDLGFVGDVEKVNINLLNKLIQENIIPVIAPIGFDQEGNSYNINADYAAVAVAGALKAEKLIFLTDVAGVLKDVNNPESLIPKLLVKDIPDYIENKVISGGMIPKVVCCTAGVKAGVKSVYILDGRIEHSLLLEIFTDVGFGTIIEE